MLHAIKEINGFNPLIDNKIIFEDFVEKKTKNKKLMKNLSKCQEIMVLEWETYQIFCIVKNIRNSLVFNYQDKQMQAFPPKYFFEEVEEDYSLKMFLYC